MWYGIVPFKRVWRQKQKIIELQLSAQKLIKKLDISFLQWQEEWIISNFIKTIRIAVVTDNEMVVSNYDMIRCKVEEVDERLLLNTLKVSKSSERIFITATATFQKNSSIKGL